MRNNPTIQPGPAYDTSFNFYRPAAEHPRIVKNLTDKLQKIVADGRSTPFRQSWFDSAHHKSGQAGPVQKNDVPVKIVKQALIPIIPQ